MGQSHSVFILRSQPFHKAHHNLIKAGLKESDDVILILGSHRSPMSIKNPWNFETREYFIKKSLEKSERERVRIVPLRDFLYSDMTWVTALQNTVAKMTKAEDKISLVGHFKDDSSYYLNFFPQWKLLPQRAWYAPTSATIKGRELIDGTEIRKRLYEETDNWQHMVPEYMVGYLTEFVKHHGEFRQLQREYQYLVDYKKSWASAPFPPTFVTTDAVVVQAGHILLVRRKTEPGKGKWALPGGFLNQNEFISACAVRELREETKIDVPAAVLDRCIKDSHCFDHPKRSLRGRSITHAYLFVLDSNKPLPSVKGDDDAELAVWMPLNDLALHEENFFEDHLAIIEYFVNKL